MILRNVLSQFFFIVKCFSKSLLVRIQFIVVEYMPPLLSLFVNDLESGFKSLESSPPTNGICDDR